VFAKRDSVHSPDNFPKRPGPQRQSREAIIFRLAALVCLHSGLASSRSVGEVAKILICPFGTLYRCSHWTAISGDRLPDDVWLSDFEPRFPAMLAA
jgi:hypothetical protein